MRESLDLAELIPRAVDLIVSMDDATRMAETLVRFLCGVSPGTDGYFWLFRPGHAVPVFRQRNHGLDADGWALKMEEAYALGSALITPSQDDSRHFFTLRAAMPADFDRTELFERVYTSRGYVDDLFHITTLPHGVTISTGLLSTKERGVFTPAEIERHERLNPVIVACMCRYEKLLPPSESQEDHALGSQVRAALNRFGTEALTERESEVVQLVLCGHSTESVAAQLEISQSTVKQHRRSAYAKLGVASMGELFFRFLETLDR